MPRATCRCGQVLSLPADGTDRTVCPACGAKIRIRLPEGGAAPAPESTEEGGFIRFACPCGRRLKVTSGWASSPTKPSHAKCPDCGRIVPVPASSASAGGPEAPTEELSAVDAAMIEAWSRRHLADTSGDPASTHVVPTAQANTPFRSEAGLRVCPGCGKPVHLGAIVCRGCGSHVPKR